MAVERLDKGTGRKLQKPAPVQLDNNRVVQGRPDGQKEPLEFVNMRLLKKLRCDAPYVKAQAGQTAPEAAVHHHKLSLTPKMALGWVDIRNDSKCMFTSSSSTIQPSRKITPRTVPRIRLFRRASRSLHRPRFDTDRRYCARAVECPVPRVRRMGRGPQLH